MWILNWLPDVVFHLILLVGVVGIIAGFVLGFIPFVSKYKLPIQVISIVMTVVGVWYEGGIAKDKEYREQIAAANQRAKIAEEKASAATAKVEYVFKDKVKVVKEVQVVIQEKIKDVSFQIDSQCRITSDSVNILNDAARNKVGGKK